MINNTETNRFELETEGYLTYASYAIEHQDILYIKYVESAPELRGKGTAGILMKDIMEFAKEKGLKVVPICTFAATWIRRHEEYHALLK